MNQDPFFALYMPQIEEKLQELLTFPKSPQDKLYEAARYSVLSRGKRLRPLLLLATVAAFEGRIESAITPACALELLHTYSLIHDDLPCMDDDDYRRGKLTLHKKYDEATAVLTGDFLLTYSFEVLSMSPTVSIDQRLQMIQALAKKAGGSGMVAGQFLDLESANTPLGLEHLKLIHRKKTADLLTASFELGGIIAGVPPELLKELLFIGEELGLAFQIIDDVIDQTASLQKHGKPTSSDALNGKKTYVTYLGVEGAELAADQLLTSTLQRLNSLPNPRLLKAMATSLVKRQG